ncbi:hypothetical protein CVT26_006676 [Gymnopilus dilepis]|uniref:Carbohydrate-binding module family 50 protein n=1 Tax=Gymnopilus dilepis TaxID=231916 RepID=A0A409Y2T1_9AGAR|nr:hypothetical protein CVT26_006676 [Gymnopilus dilepis]
MSRNWTHYEEDATRLPEGFRRVAYDADTRRYTFKDANGLLYHGEPGEEYGILTPIPPSHSAIEHTRPSAFAPEGERRLSPKSSPVTSSSPPPKTFHDILPPELIATPSVSKSTSESPSSSTIKAGSRMVNAVRKSTLPKMQGVVHTLRRSVTSIRKSKSPAFDNQNALYDDDMIGLIGNTSTSSVASSDRPPYPNGPRSIPPRRSTLDVNFTSAS